LYFFLLFYFYFILFKGYYINAGNKTIKDLDRKILIPAWKLEEDDKHPGITKQNKTKQNKTKQNKHKT